MGERNLILILGGARSGKSAFAQRLAAEANGEVLVLATAQAGDAEMAARIDSHRAERPAHWSTVEAPQEVARALSDGPPASVVVLDCVTLWVTNLLLAENGNWEGAKRELEALLNWYRSHSVELIVVSNEVGLGIVPADETSRLYRDWLGWFNQRLAAEADAVYLMVAGLPVEVKSLVGARHSPKIDG